MKVRTAVYALMVVVIVMVVGCGPSSAESSGQSEMYRFVKKIYDSFQKAGLEEETPHDFDFLYPMASEELTAAMKREEACWKKDDFSQCKYSASLLVGGQDYLITDVSIAEVWKEDGSVEVEAVFKNFGEDRRVVYVFKKENGSFKLQDVLVKDEYPSSLLKELSD